MPNQNQPAPEVKPGEKRQPYARPAILDEAPIVQDALASGAGD